jgi:putative transposase
MDILTFFACFETLATPTSCRRLAIIAQAMLTMTGRITMLSISRWTTQGGSYRTVNRFFAATLSWSELLVKFFQTHLFNPKNEYILAGDETVVSKSGTETFGIDRFFSGLKSKVIKGLSFFVLSLINVAERKSYPLCVKQTIRSEAEKEAIKKRKEKSAKKIKKTKSKPPGRRKGSLNKDKTKLELSSELLRIDELLKVLLKLMRVFVQVKYLALDGHFGHHQAVLMARENDLHLISKLRKDAGLYEKYEGGYGGRGARKKYGEKLNYERLPKKYVKKSEREGDVVTNYYQGIFLSKSFGSELNVLIIEKINLKSEKVGHAILFSSDVELGWEKLLEYYSLRFQIEFNFRDAKQHFGLEDFMNQTEVGVENAANLSFLMVNVCAKLLKESDGKCVGINDLKSQFRGIKYALETIKLIQPKAESILIEKVKEAISRIGSIHRHNFSASSA